MTTRGSDVLVSSALGGAPSTFRLDHVIDQSSGQESMFDVVRPQLDDALAGFNTTVFAVSEQLSRVVQDIECRLVPCTRQKHAHCRR